MTFTTTLDSFTDSGEAFSAPSTSIPLRREKYGWLESVVPTLDRPFYKDTVQTDIFGGQLPGNGSPGLGCGLPIPHVCDSCGVDYWAESQCKQKACPDCYQEWARLRGSACSDRVWMGRAYWYRGHPVRVLHVVVSFRIQEDGWTPDDYKLKVRAILKRHGATGGLMIRHTMRRGDDEERQPDGCVHYHTVCLVPGKFELGGQPEDGQVIVKIIEDKISGGFKGIKRKKGVAGLCQYLLTHASVKAREQSVTYFGLLSYNKMSQKTLNTEFPEAFEAIKDSHRARCKCCDSTEVRVLPWIYREFCVKQKGMTIRQRRDYAKAHPRPLDALLLLPYQGHANITP